MKVIICDMHCMTLFFLDKTMVSKLLQYVQVAIFTGESGSVLFCMSDPA